MKKTTTEEGEKKILLNTINSSGAILEEQVFSVLSKSQYANGMEKNKTFTFREERMEIDCLLPVPPLRFLFECKRSFYTFYFLRSSEYRNAGYVIQQKKGMKTIELGPQALGRGGFKIFPYCLEVLEDQGVFQRAKKGKVDFAPEQAERAGREEILHSFTRQTLKNLQGCIWKLHQEPAFLAESVSFFPVIVTNAKLYSIEYALEQIDADGNLQDFNNPKEEKYVGFNFSDSVKWDEDKQEILTETGSFEKTVFVVNVNHIVDFIDKIKSI